MINLKDKYIKEVIPKMRERFGYKNDLAVPKIEKVVLNIGIGKIRQDAKIVEEIKKSLALIAGQIPIETRAKKAIATFKTREGNVVGLKVTLRNKKMYDFLERLINLSLPRSRDFTGLLSSSIDQKGNLTIGIKEHIIFPEIIGEDIRHIFGMEICILTAARKKEEGIELLKLMGFPIKKS